MASLKVAQRPASIAVCAVFALLCTSIHAAQPFGVNDGGFDFTDVMKTSSRWSTPSGATVNVDANGWPTADASLVLFDVRRNMPWNGPDPDAVNPTIEGTYHLIFTGQATISGSSEDGSVAIQNQSYDSGSNTTSADVVIPPGRWLITLNFTNSKRRPGDAAGTGFTNVQLLRPGVLPDSKQTFTEPMLRAYSQGFSYVRFMGSAGTNDYQSFCGSQLIVAKWTDRPQVTDAYQGGLPAKNTGCAQSHGVAWEYMIMLANQANTGLWVNVPISADDDYVRQFATLLHDGDQYTPGVNAGLPIYVEYSNEVWNPGFQAFSWNNTTASKNGITPLQQYVKRTIEISNIFRQVWGDAAMNTTIRPVVLWQYTNEMNVARALTWAETQFNASASRFLYGIGEAPYYGPSDTSSVDNIFDTMWSESDRLRTDFIGWETVARFFGLKEVGYESGPSLDVNNGAKATRDARMTASEVHHFLDNWFAVGGDAVGFFSLRGAVSPWGDWLLMEDFEYPDTPKNAGALSILSAPQPALTSGNLLPWSAGQTTSFDGSQATPETWATESQTNSTVQLCSPGCDPGFALYPLRASADNTSYNVTVPAHATQGSPKLDVLIDDVLVGTVTPASGSTDSQSTVTTGALSSGAHTLMLRVSGNGRISIGPNATISFALASGGGNGAVPSAPTNLRATSGDGRVSLTWAATASANSYSVKRSPASGGPYSTVATVSGNSYTDSGIPNGQVNYYVVTAINSVGESALSPQIRGIAYAQKAPAGPGNVQASGDAVDDSIGKGGFVYLSWDRTDNADHYTVQRSNTSGAGYTDVQTVLANSYLDMNLSAGTKYYYRVVATNPTGSMASGEVSVTPKQVVPAAPTNVSAIGFGVVFLRWDPVRSEMPSYGQQYRVLRSTAAGGPYTSVTTLSTANYVDTDVTLGTTYYYVVRAMKSVGESANSAEVNATP